MDPKINPFSPGAGSPPPELAGRQELLLQTLTALARIKRGRSEKSVLLIGLRGTGKTVLLYEISKIAENEHYQVVMIETHEKKYFGTRDYAPILYCPFSKLFLPTCFLLVSDVNFFAREKGQ